MNSTVMDVTMWREDDRVEDAPVRRSWIDRLFGRFQSPPRSFAPSSTMVLFQPGQSEAPPTRMQQKMDRFLPDPELSESELDEYVATAKRVGVNPRNLGPAVIEQRLLRVLKDANIPVYNAKQVHDYMRAVARKAGFNHYVWRPLRESDDPKGCRFQHVDNYYGDGRILKGLYRHIIPASVLGTVATIAESDPSVRFFATDYEAKSPDPFLACTKPGLPFFVIDFWSEPGFRPS